MLDLPETISASHQPWLQESTRINCKGPLWGTQGPAGWGTSSHTYTPCIDTHSHPPTLTTHRLTSTHCRTQAMHTLQTPCVFTHTACSHVFSCIHSHIHTHPGTHPHTHSHTPPHWLTHGTRTHSQSLTQTQHRFEPRSDAETRPCSFIVSVSVGEVGLCPLPPLEVFKTKGRREIPRRASPHQQGGAQPWRAGLGHFQKGLRSCLSPCLWRMDWAFTAAPAPGAQVGAGHHHSHPPVMASWNCWGGGGGAGEGETPVSQGLTKRASQVAALFLKTILSSLQGLWEPYPCVPCMVSPAPTPI